LRHVPHGTDPRSRPQPPGDNRWQRGAVVDALYLADDEDTLWAEWYRNLAERGLPPARQLPRDVWRHRVPSLEAADLRDASGLGRVGLASPVPGRAGWKPFQQVGESLWREGWPGLVAPSAARADGLILCLFIERPGFLPARPLGRPRVVREPPAPPTGMQT
jgi:RES domain-containing protein